jgi:XTP/dITP diphosphohydrolase
MESEQKEKKMDLLLATRNVNKTREFAEILGNKFQISDLSTLEDIPRVEETGRTFEENAILKALALSKSPPVSDGARVEDRPALVVADDSGLEVDALDRAPGIFSARYAGEHATAKQNIDKLLGELSRRKVPLDRRSARFRCVIALARAGKLLGRFEGTIEGTIIKHPRGDRGFGYDPIFQPNGFDKTFGELSAEAKNKISHRGKALAALREFLRWREIARAPRD